MPKIGGPSKTNIVIKYTFYYIAIIILAVLIIEGPDNTKRFLYYISRPLAERIHTQHDELLGWINIPNVYIHDMYGPDVYLRTNTQSFRNDTDFPVEVPNGKKRIICSGDSFTLGFGVDNDHTWCHRLVEFDQQLESVNMGQGGYGIDQSYLWYMRDGRELNHQIHLFAFIEPDIDRVNQSSLFGYPKPVLKLENNIISVNNVPVPRRAYIVPWVTRSLNAIKELKTFRLLKALTQNALPKKRREKQNLDLILKIFETLHQENKKKKSDLYVVLLPTMANFRAPNTTGKLFREELAKKGIAFIDLIDEIKKMPVSKLHNMFITEEHVPYKFAAGHYSENGHEFIAQQIYNKLRIKQDN